MPRLNQDLAGSLQSNTFESKIKNENRFVDLNFNGYKIGENPQDILKFNERANANRVLLWLASGPNDYVRESIKGGILYNLIGKISTDSNLKNAEALIRESFNTHFANDLTLMHCNLSIDHRLKQLNINIIVMDKLTSEISNISTGVLI